MTYLEAMERWIEHKGYKKIKKTNEDGSIELAVVSPLFSAVGVEVCISYETPEDILTAAEEFDIEEDFIDEGVTLHVRGVDEEIANEIFTDIYA